MTKAEKALLENENYNELQSGDLTKSELTLEQNINIKKKKKLKKKIGQNIKNSKSTMSLSGNKKRSLYYNYYIIIYLHLF